MNRSTNYNFYLPGSGDYRDVSQLNYNFETIDSSLYSAVTRLNSVLLYTSTVSETSISAFGSALVTILSNMSDGEIRFVKALSNWSGGSPTSGAYAIAILYRRTNGNYKISIPDTCTTGYYYSNEWHWTRATMSSVTF